METTLNLATDRCFEGDAKRKETALYLYSKIKGTPLICPHGHVDPRVLSEPNYSFGTPSDLIIIPDHYLFRMLYSQGMSLESVGVNPKKQGKVGVSAEKDARLIWQIFAENYHLFYGTPSKLWLDHVFVEIFGIKQKLNGQTAQVIYDEIDEKMKTPELRPRALFERFNIEVLATTDAATDTLDQHKIIRESGWDGKVIPTFRPDAVVNLDTANWHDHIQKLSEVSDIAVHDYASFIQALEHQRKRFKNMGAVATDHAARSAYTGELGAFEANAIFQRALKNKLNSGDAELFTGHLLMEMARMSSEDGLVMQLHPGSFRNHNQLVYDRFGTDKGADIPLETEYTTNLLPLLNKYGNNKRFGLILFTLDETTYSRELAPIAGHYPAVKLGPPWWFYDSLNGIARYFDLVMETAGIYNTAGFNDDTRAFCSIPARHDVWRRACANWLSGLVNKGLIDREEAEIMIIELAYGLAKRAYRL
jgi:glucuronate isomerase